jgi:hypothetical protein
LGDSAVESRHGKEPEIFKGGPRSDIIAASGLTKVDVEGQFEMGIGVFERSKEHFSFDTNPQLVFGKAQQLQLRIFPMIDPPVRELPQTSQEPFGWPLAEQEMPILVDHGGDGLDKRDSLF